MSDEKTQVEMAEEALAPYLEFNGRIDAFISILNDLRHYADAHKINFHSAVDASYQRYLFEKG